ncbi:MAG: hypothetical protein LBN06_07385 [Prevotellaceae bacterium]|jgi:hypothetical protein|nr:hypothetical protein [Prevotellaceae bacterium]
MKYVKWIFVVLLISSLTSFVEKDKTTGGLNVGDVAPNFNFALPATSHEPSEQSLSLIRGRYVLLSFWACYDAHSRVQNAELNHALQQLTPQENIEMVSVAFDRYASVFEETIRADRISAAACFVDTRGNDSGIYRKYRLSRGFTNYLLNGQGVIVAKDLSPADLDKYLN